MLFDYGFGSSDIERIERLPQRVKNVNFRVRAGGRDWVLKSHTSPSAAERASCSHQLELKLFDAGFPVAQLQRSESGATVVQDGATSYSLHAWVSGQQISIDRRDETLEKHPDLVSELATALGTYHRLALGWAAPEDTREPVAPDRLLEGPRHAVTSIRRGRPPQLFKAYRLRFRARKSSFDRWILNSLPDLYRHADRLAATSIGRLVDPSDVVMAHNDINWENLIFDETFNLLALLDFDNAMQLPRVLDVGAAAAVLVGSHGPRLEEFLSVYDETSGRAVDRQLVDVGMHLKCVRSILWSVDSYLSGRAADPELLATWCSHLYACLPELAGRGRSRSAVPVPAAPP